MAVFSDSKRFNVLLSKQGSYCQKGVKMIFFKTWIKQFNDLPKAIGDLARDIEADHIDFPKSNDYNTIHFYLNIQKRACPDAMRTFDEAWHEYELYLLAKDVDENPPSLS